MYAVLRSYSGAGARELFDVLVGRKAEIEQLIRAVPGFVSYTLIQTGDGGHTLTVCRDKAGIDESIRTAREWIQTNAKGIHVAPPVISEGAVGLNIS
jgi:hypothetical protein